MEKDPQLHLFGEDVLDPYGGAFKVTRGLSTRYPERVRTTPISEAGIVGLAAGMALRGKPSIVEIMFGDFLGLAMDQLLNHAAKLPWMYDGKVDVPLIVRTPMGGRRGYGPTHSQSIEKHFCGIPGLAVLAIDQFSPIAPLYREAYESRRPTLIIENKILYSRMVEEPDALPRPPSPELILLAYGGSVEVARAAALLLEEEEIAVEVLAVPQLSPFPDALLLKAAARCRCFIAVEEASLGWGFAERCALSLINAGVRFAALGGPDHPLPNSRPWEERVLPSAGTISAAALKLLDLA